MWYWYKDWHINQWNGVESPGIDSHIFGQFNFKKTTKVIQRKKDSIQQVVLEQLDIHMERYKSQTSSYTINRNQLKMDQNQNVKN